MLKIRLMMGLCLLSLSCSTPILAKPPVEESPQAKGMRYLTGNGVPQNSKEGFFWINQAAKLGSPFAQNELGYLYAAGVGVKRDPVQAFKWYQKAAKQNLVSAQYNLGLFFLHGIGTEKNPTLAKIWFEKAAARGFGPARQALQ